MTRDDILGTMESYWADQQERLEALFEFFGESAPIIVSAWMVDGFVAKTQALEAEIARGDPLPPVEYVREVLGLDIAGRDILLVALFYEWLPAWRRRWVRTFPEGLTVGALVQFLGSAVLDNVALAQAPLRRSGLIRVHYSASQRLSDAELSLHPLAVPGLQSLMEFERGPLQVRHGKAVAGVFEGAAWLNLDAAMVVWPGSPLEAAALASDLAAQLDVRLVELDLAQLQDPKTEFSEQVQAALVAAYLTPGAVLAIIGIELLDEPTWRWVVRRAAEYPGWVWVAGENLACHDVAVPFPKIILSEDIFGVEVRRRAWNAFAPDLEDAHLGEFCRNFEFGPGRVELALRQARDTAAQRGDKLRWDDVGRAARRLLRAAVPGAHFLDGNEAAWANLVVCERVKDDLAAISAFAKHHAQLFDEWKILEGYTDARGLVVLFSGPPGTGKTMAARGVAAHLGVDLIAVDLGQVVSKYIGETEKNLTAVFRAARRTNAVLFFDEADSLFARRTEVGDARDRYANLEAAHLLQEVEQHSGITILASNLKQNLDPAFLRRIHQVIEFDPPNAEERKKLWERALGRGAADLTQVSARYSLTGGQIKTAALWAGLRSLSRGTPAMAVDMDGVREAIRRELDKVGEFVGGEDGL